jgi:hypothetical protein
MSDAKQADAPTRELIAAKAFELYYARSREDGHDMEHWFAAQALLAATPAPLASDASRVQEGSS